MSERTKMPIWKVTRAYIVRAGTEQEAIDETYDVDHEGYFIGDGAVIVEKAEKISDEEAATLSEAAGSEIHFLWEGR